MPIHGVLFDLGGTLLDNADPARWAADAAALGVPVEPDHLAHVVRELDVEIDGPKRPGLAEFFQTALERAAGTPIPPDTGAKFLARRPPGVRELPIFSDVRYCLERLDAGGFALGVVSNSTGEADVRRYLDKAGILGFFRTVVSSGTEGVAKPDPEIFRRALERLGGVAAETVYVGDLPYTDAQAASLAGLHGVWLNRYGWGFGDDPPEINSLTEVPGLVRRIA